MFSSRRYSRSYHFARSLSLLLVVPFALTGCGGGGGGSSSSPSSPSQTTTASTPVALVVDWAQRSAPNVRAQPADVAAPASALSGVVTLTGAGTSGGDVTFSFNRDANINPHSSTYTSGAAADYGTWPATITFYAQANGGGTTVGVAQETVTINSSNASLGTVQTSGTVASVAVTPATGLTVGQTAQLQFTAYAAASSGGTIIAVTPGSAVWQLSGGSAASVSVQGVATATAAGAAQATATVDGVTSPAATVFVTEPNIAQPAVLTAFKYQALLGNVPNTAGTNDGVERLGAGTGGNGNNFIIWGVKDNNGTPVFITEAAIWQSDPTKAVYVTFDSEQRPTQFTDQASGLALTIAYPSANQYVLTLVDPSGNTLAQATATVDSAGNVTYQNAASANAKKLLAGAKRIGLTQANAQAKKNIFGIDSDEPDGDSDDANAYSDDALDQLTFLATELQEGLSKTIQKSVQNYQTLSKVFIGLSALTALSGGTVLPLAFAVAGVSLMSGGQFLTNVLPNLFNQNLQETADSGGVTPTDITGDDLWPTDPAYNANLQDPNDVGPSS